MGIICSSHELTTAAIPTAKLILKDGNLEEFLYPVKVSKILATKPDCFICDADYINYDNYIPAIEGDEELQLGQLYFALPLNWLNTRLIGPREMAALAVKATLALNSIGGGEARRRRSWRGKISRVDPLVYHGHNKVVDCSRVVNGVGNGGSGGSVVNRKGRGGGRSSSKFSPNLSAIVE